MSLDIELLELDCKKLEKVVVGTTSTEDAVSILDRWDGIIPNGTEKILPMRRYLKRKTEGERDRHYFLVDAHGLRNLGRMYFRAQEKKELR